MKLGETSDAIYATVFNIDEKIAGTEYPIADSAKLLIYEDGTTEWVDYGTARAEHTAELEIVDLLKADYFSLTEFVKANVGNKIRFTLSHDAENPWVDTAFMHTDGYFYASIIGYEDNGEEEFSVTDQLYSIKLKISYTGTTSTAVPNASDTSLRDVCFEVDTIRANVVAADLTALEATASPVGGWIGLAVDTHKLYIYDASEVEWTFLFTIAPDDPEWGLVNGVFYLSAFADISAASPGSESRLWKAGLINSQSIKFSSANIDLSNGPTVETLEGFSFSLNNVDKFFNYINENKITLGNALVKEKFYDRTNGVMSLNRTGENYNNSFDYHNYSFQVEPEIMNAVGAFPNTVYDRVTTPNAASEMMGKTIISTFGRWQKGELQVSNFTIKQQKFSTGRRYLKMVSVVGAVVTVDIDSTEFLKLLNVAAVGDYPGNDPVKYIYLQIMEQEDQPDIGVAVLINSFAASGSNTALTLSRAFKADPTSLSVFQIFLSAVELVIDDDPVVGMRKPDYLKRTNGNTAIPFELYAKIEDDLEQVPDNIYRAVGTEENTLTIRSEALDVDNFGTTTVTDASKELTRLPGKDVVTTLLPGVASDRAYNFGFTPEGSKSAVAEITGSIGDSGGTTAIASSDRITVCWTWAGAGGGGSSTRLYKYRFTRIAKDFNYNNNSYSENLVGNFDVTGLTYYVDTDVDAGFFYMYRLHRLHGMGSTVPQNHMDPLERGGHYKIDPSNSAGAAIKGKVGGVLIGSGVEATLIWNLQANQTQVRVYRDDILIDTITSTTQTYYVVAHTGSTVKHKYYIKVSVSTLGDNADTWYITNGEAATRGDLWFIKKAADAYSDTKYWWGHDDHEYLKNDGYRVKNFIGDNGATLPAAGVVFSWPIRIDKTVLPDLSNAKDVRILSDFIIRSSAHDSTQIPVLIQLRGVRADGTSVVLRQHTSGNNGLQTASGDNGYYYAKFLNLPQNKSGEEVNYTTEQQETNADGKYTGKDMWKLPDWLFSDDAFEWNKLEHFVFVVTNAVPILPALFDSNKKGYKIGYGPHVNSSSSTLKVEHKDKFFLEFTKSFEGGLDTPQFARIDGGVIDDASGTFTGTPSLIIERARHIANYIVYKLLGYLPNYIGTEMKSRDNWLCRFQTKEARDLQAMLQLVAKNLFGCFTLNANGRVNFRTLDIDEPKIQTVFAFTDSNIIKDSVSKPVFRKQTDIFQQYKFKYNYEPSAIITEADSDEGKEKNRAYTEEIIVGWDLVQGKKIAGGFSRKELDADENIVDNIDEGDENKLADLCKVSSFLNTTGGKVNQFGYEKDELLEFFYRPTQAAVKTNEAIELELPEATVKTLHGPMLRSPKRSVQDRIGREIKFRSFNAWKLSFKCNIKYVVHSTLVNGIADEVGTVSRKLKLLDKVTFNHAFFTNGITVPCFITGINPDHYNGTATITVFMPKPPGQLLGFIDHRWDAGFGERANADFVFKSNDYGLTNEEGTFANAGYGTRINADFKFPDGTMADSEGKGTGKL